MQHSLAGDARRPTCPPRSIPKKQTAVLLVNAYGGLGIHTLLILLKTFPSQYQAGLFRLGRRARLGQLQGHGGSRASCAPTGSGRSTSSSCSRARSASPPTASTRSAPIRWRNRPSSALQIREKFPALGLLRRQAALRGGEVVLPAPAQRDRLRHLAPPAASGHPDRRHAHPHPRLRGLGRASPKGCR